MPILFPLQLLLATFAGWVNRHQAQAIDYLIEENRVLKEQLGGKRLRQGTRPGAQGRPKSLVFLLMKVHGLSHE